MGLRKNRNGTIGFYDEIPAFFIITTALVIFFISALNAYNNYTQQREDILSLEDTQEFMEGIRTSPVLTHDGQPGIFDSSKIIRLNVDNITKRMKIPERTFFRVVITDLGNYFDKYDVNITNAVIIQDLVTVREYHNVITTPIAIWVSDEQVHPGQLKVEMWK